MLTVTSESTPEKTFRLPPIRLSSYRLPLFRLPARRAVQLSSRYQLSR
jgi:hypothetical protein